MLVPCVNKFWMCLFMSDIGKKTVRCRIHRREYQHELDYYIWRRRMELDRGRDDDHHKDKCRWGRSTARGFKQVRQECKVRVKRSLFCSLYFYRVVATQFSVSCLTNWIDDPIGLVIICTNCCRISQDHFCRGRIIYDVYNIDVYRSLVTKVKNIIEFKRK